MKIEIIVFGGGCFWCTEAIFKQLQGVQSVEPGYAGGTTPDPSYENIGDHAEVIKIEYDPEKIKLEDLLTVFFATHDPTTLNRQGADVGTQYRSVVLCSSEKQKDIAIKFIDNLNNQTEFGDPIVTEVEMLKKFFLAEEYHQNYYSNNPNSVYCQVVINPILKKVKEQFAKLLL